LQGKDEFSLSKNNKYNGNKRGWGAFPIFAGLRIPTPVFVRLTPGSFAGQHICSVAHPENYLQKNFGKICVAK